MAQAQWTATQIVGKRIKKLRELRGLSAQKLAHLCNELGAPEINRQVITNLENGRRKIVTIDEVLVLAHALNAPPVLLFTPVGWDAALKVTPTVSLPPMEAMRWVSGEEPLTEADRREWHEVAAPVSLLREYHSRALNVARLKDRADIFEAALHRVAEQADLLVEAGVPVPPLPRTWVDLLRERDMLRYPDVVPVSDDEAEPSDG